MAEEKEIEEQSQGGGMTLGHLLMAIGFFMPVETVIMEFRRANGRVLDYIIGVPLAIGLGTLIVWLNWTFGKRLWIRSQGYSKNVRNAIALGAFSLDFVWIIVGLVAALGLVSLLRRFVA